MKRATALSFALLLGSIPLAAQNARQQAQPTPQVPSGSDVCPVSLRAEQKAAGEVLAADKSRPKGVAQHLQLTLAHPGSRRIARARVTVHGLTAKGRVTPTPTRRQNPSDASRTFDLTFHAGPNDKAASADLWVRGLTAVLTVDLDSVTFADGSIWTLKGRDACRIVPDPLMLVADR